jgi:hypothetical protein
VGEWGGGWDRDAEVGDAGRGQAWHCLDRPGDVEHPLVVTDQRKGADHLEIAGIAASASFICLMPAATSAAAGPHGIQPVPKRARRLTTRGHPLFSLENVMPTPHSAGGAPEVLAVMATTAAGLTLDALRGHRPRHLINLAAWERHVERFASSNGG